MDSQTKEFIDGVFERSKNDPFTVTKDDILRMLSMDTKT